MRHAKHIAVFKKNVMVRDHRGTLKAQEMRVLFEAEGSRIRTIEAVGDVEIVQEGRIAQSHNALIKSSEGVIELTGNPKIKQGKDIYSAERITIFSKTNQVVFEPKARLVIYQQSGEKGGLL
jgi:lipopolysaccharide export system protein LptA